MSALFAEREFLARRIHLIAGRSLDREDPSISCGWIESFATLKRGSRASRVSSTWCTAGILPDRAGKQTLGPALADRSSRQLLNRLSRLDVLLIDELGYLTLKPEQSNIFFKLMEERYHRHATIITTNLSYGEWGNFLGNPTMVDALLSRVRHYCHTIQIDGPSLRDPQG